MNIVNKIDYVSEGISLLIKQKKDKSIKEQVISSTRKLCYNPDDLLITKKDVISFYDEIEADFRKEFKNDMDQVNEYFGPLFDNKSYSCIGRILLLWDEFSHAQTKPLDEFAQDLLSMDETKYYIEFAQSFQGLGQTLRDSSQYATPTCKDDVFRIIMATEYSDSEKLCFLEYLSNYKEHLNNCLSILRRTVNLLKKKEKKIQKLRESFITYWADVFCSEDPVEFFKRNNEELTSLPHNKHGHIITIEIFNGFAKGVSVSMDDETMECLNPYILPIGILYCDECPLIYSYTNSGNAISTENYIDQLKLMSDKNRFEILSFIKDKEAFGNELANHLGLTTATVSHHTSNLTSHSLVNLNQQGAKLYYSSNKEVIKNCLEYFKGELL